MSRSWNDILHDPRIDDSGDYDYLAEELPQDDTVHVTRCHCDGCGKDRLWGRTSTHYFYCYDGWDSMSYTECWVCELQGKMRRVKRIVRTSAKRHKTFVNNLKLMRTSTVKGQHRAKVQVARQLAFNKEGGN